jgi:cyclohexanone monooxygenase
MPHEDRTLIRDFRHNVAQTISGEEGEVMSATQDEALDVVVIGAGFAGMYALHKMRDVLGLSTRVFETGDGVGGTWYWNRYPGARCDVESLDYSYTFDEELYKGWTWSERYATQPEIERYANYVADTLDLRRDISFETRVTAAHYDEGSARWTVETDRGDRVTCDYVLAGTGCLSAWQVPAFPGVETFQGEHYHTGQWPKDGVDLAGKRVGIIGTGSSGVQSIPVLAEQSQHLTVFQRTPNFSLPAGQATLPEGVADARKAAIKEWREAAWLAQAGTPTRGVTNRSVLEDTREAAFARFEENWGIGGGFTLLGLYNDLTMKEESNAVIADYVRDKIRGIVQDPETAEALCPKDHPFGTKRLILDTNYFETYNRDNVDLVDVRANPIATITPKGIRLEDGTEHELDVIVFATGFDAMTGALTRIDIRGRDGLTMGEAWAEGPKTYLGLQVAGFPNFFTITGPGSPSVLCSMIFAIEQHVDWIADCITYLREHGHATIEASEPAQTAWVEHVNEVASKTLYPKANSWYLGANIPGKARVFMPYVGGMPAYKAKCDEVAANGYDGFVLGGAAVAA